MWASLSQSPWARTGAQTMRDEVLKSPEVALAYPPPPTLWMWMLNADPYPISTPAAKQQ